MQNLTLAKTVLNNITQHPESFRMARWGVTLPPRGLFFRNPGGYVACLAGHTLIAGGYTLKRDDMYIRGREEVFLDEISVLASELLGLTADERDHTYFGHGEHDCFLFCGRVANWEARTVFGHMIQAEEQRRELAVA